METIEQNWYIIFGLIIIGILYLYKNHSKSLERKNKNDIELLIWIIGFLLLIITIQIKLFSEHLFFIISFPLILPSMVILILYILRDNVKILIEGRQQGEEFYEMGVIGEESGIRKTISQKTGVLVHIIDNAYYETLDYFGNPASPFKNVGDRVKFCDYFNGKMIYCPDNPLLANITFWASQTTWITFKRVIPDIMKTNLTLTDLVDYKIQFHMNEMRKNFPHALIGTEKQYEHKPFNLEKSIEEKMKELMAEYHKTLSTKADKSINETKTEGEKQND